MISTREGNHFCCEHSVDVAAFWRHQTICGVENRSCLLYTSGDRIQDIERLVGALEDIKRLYSKDKTGLLSGEYINPKVAVSPQERCV